MRALLPAAIYFGSFLAIGLIVKVLAGRWMRKSGAHLSELQAQAGRRRSKRRLFLLGAWRNEE
jgi:hypothetical protein